MDEFNISLSGPDLVRFSSAVDTINKELTRLQGGALPSQTQPSLTTLSEAWRQLVVLLDRSPVPKRRACPHCRNMITVGATRCGYCWKEVPPPSAANEESARGKK